MPRRLCCRQPRHANQPNRLFSRLPANPPTGVFTCVRAYLTGEMRPRAIAHAPDLSRGWSLPAIEQIVSAIWESLLVTTDDRFGMPPKLPGLVLRYAEACPAPVRFRLPSWEAALVGVSGDFDRESGNRLIANSGVVEGCQMSVTCSRI